LVVYTQCRHILDIGTAHLLRRVNGNGIVTEHLTRRSQARNHLALCLASLCSSALCLTGQQLWLTLVQEFDDQFWSKLPHHWNRASRSRHLQISHQKCLYPSSALPKLSSSLSRQLLWHCLWYARWCLSSDGQCRTW